MMKPQLRRLHSPDAPDLAAFAPADPNSFGILVQALIGPADGRGEEAFDFLVCTPLWLAEQLRSTDFVMGRHHLVVDHYDLVTIESAIRSLCDSIERDNWAGVGDVLSRFGRWEFEDYVE